MQQPKGFFTPNKMYRLVKFLFLLKQAPNQQHLKFENVMMLNGKINECDTYIDIHLFFYIYICQEHNITSMYPFMTY